MINLLQEAALKGGEVLRSYFRKEIEMKQKTSHQNIVTTADFESQRVITNYLEKELVSRYKIDPTEIGYICEEGLYKPGKYTFVIDPLDGTSNFATGLDLFSVCIALFVDGVLKYGVVYLPIQDRLYFAEKNKGAFKKEKGKVYKLVSTPIDFKNVYLSGGFHLAEEKRKELFSLYNHMYEHFRAYIHLNSGGISICLVAENVSGLDVGRGGIWDIAGPYVIVEEAGATMVDRSGKPISYDLSDPNKYYPYFVCNKKNLPKILELMK